MVRKGSFNHISVHTGQKARAARSASNAPRAGQAKRPQIRPRQRPARWGRCPVNGPFPGRSAPWVYNPHGGTVNRAAFMISSNVGRPPDDGPFDRPLHQPPSGIRGRGVCIPLPPSPRAIGAGTAECDQNNISPGRGERASGACFREGYRPIRRPADDVVGPLGPAPGLGSTTGTTSCQAPYIAVRIRSVHRRVEDQENRAPSPLLEVDHRGEPSSPALPRDQAARLDLHLHVEIAQNLADQACRIRWGSGGAVFRPLVGNAEAAAEVEAADGRAPRRAIGASDP